MIQTELLVSIPQQLQTKAWFGTLERRAGYGKPSAAAKKVPNKYSSKKSKNNDSPGETDCPYSQCVHDARKITYASCFLRNLAAGVTSPAERLQQLKSGVPGRAMCLAGKQVQFPNQKSEIRLFVNCSVF